MKCDIFIHSNVLISRFLLLGDQRVGPMFNRRSHGDANANSLDAELGRDDSERKGTHLSLLNLQLLGRFRRWPTQTLLWSLAITFLLMLGKFVARSFFLTKEGWCLMISASPGKIGI